MLNILGQYEATLGQAINHQKPSLFFSKNTKPDVKRTIQHMLGAKIMTDSDRYLGLPMATGKSKVDTFKDLEEKITTCVMGWKEKFISKAGCEVLIKMLAQAIPTYSICLFKLPKSICDNINSLLVGRKPGWKEDSLDQLEETLHTKKEGGEWVFLIYVLLT